MSNRLKADIVLLSIAIIWGMSYPVTSRMLAFITPFTILMLRCFSSLPILIPIYGRKIIHSEKGLIKSGLILGILVGLGMSMVLYGLSLSTSLNTALIVGITSPLTALFSTIILKKKPDAYTILGLVFCFIGAYFMGGGFNYRLNIGDIIIFTSDFFFVTQTLLIDKFNEKYNSALLGTVQIAASAIVSLVIWLITGADSIIINRTIILGIIFTGIFGLGLAFTFQVMAQKYTTPTHTSILLGSEPVFGMIFSFIVPNASGIYETLTLNKLTGCILVLSGILLSELSPLINSMKTKNKTLLS